jgi:AAA+ ATPase superfamily predicted ATPase
MFIGRDKEIRQLADLLVDASPKVAVIYGRRRIGKSYLIQHVCKDGNVFNFEGLEKASKAKQIRNFLFQLEQQSKKEIPDKSKIKSWSEAISKLVPFLEEEASPVLILDEFQWMAGYRSLLVSELKMMFDQYLSKIPGFKLILCGSIASFMVNRVIKSSAFYGRIDLEIHLKEFSLNEVKEVLHSHSKEDALLAYLILGGVPKYLNYIKPGDSIPLAIQRVIFNKVAVLRDEFNKIFVSHFGENSAYSEIIRELKKSTYGLTKKQIQEKTSSTGGGQTTKELFDLEMAGFIKGFIPFNKSANAKDRKYKLVDSYSSFYLNFVEPSDIRKNEVDFFNSIYTQAKFRSWLGIMFELACFKHSDLIAKILGFSGINYSSGPFWRRSLEKDGISSLGVQFDLIFQRADKVLTICEIKYGTQSLGIELGKELQNRIANSPELNERTIQTVLITNCSLSKELQQSAYFNRIINADELFGCL